MKKITLSDIAKKTGYSVNTVSHALHNKPDISQNAKIEITKCAEELGYIANLSAGALRSGKSKSIAIIVGDISNPHFSIMIKEIESRLRGYGYSAFILNTDEDEKIERSAIVSAISKNVDGIIICPVQKSTENIDFIKKSDIPYVLIGRRFEDSFSNCVICDDINGGFAAAEHLIQKKHKNILFINAPLYISSASDRYEGIKRAVAESGLPDDALKTVECGMSKNGDIILNALKKNSDCTGIICFSDLIAMQVCYYLKKLGKIVPEDVSVIGFDNIVSKFIFPVMLTSVTSSKTKMSVKAVDVLMDIINKKAKYVQQIILPTKVIARDSTQKI